MSEFYQPELARGVRWNDPEFEIGWLGDVEVISQRDRSYSDFKFQWRGSLIEFTFHLTVSKTAELRSASVADGAPQGCWTST